MADEIEIKLRVPSKMLETAKKMPWLQPLICGPIARKTLRSVYFDTAKFKLRDKGVVLRVRHQGRKRLQAVKSEGDQAFARNEWEGEIGGDEPDLARLKGTPLSRLKKLKLRPVFETVVTRTTIPLRSNGSELELALDKGSVRTTNRRQPISEIEIELKNGDPAEVVRLARCLSSRLPVIYEPKSKPERGYALIAGESGCAVRARPVSLSREVTVAGAFCAIGLECVRHLASNEGAVRAADPEGVHQMRVGLRRLRAAISLFKELLRDPESEAIKAELKWLTEQLGPARDFDVFVRESVAPLQDAAAEVTVLREEMEQKRDDGFSRARSAVDSERYRKLVLNTVFWLASGAWSTNQDDLARALRERDAVSFASEILELRIAGIIRKAKKLKKLDAHKRHKLRIAIKKLRYAGEFFGALFDGGKARKRQRRLAETLEQLQDALGRLNDFTVHRKLAGDIVRRGKNKDRRPEKAFAMGLVTGREQSKYEVCITAAKKASGRLAARRPFWQ